MSFKDRLAAAKAKAAEEPSREMSTLWDPRPGHPSENEPELAGVLKRRDSVKFDWGEREVLEIEDESGKLRSVWLGPTTLINAVAQASPNIGDGMVFHYHGKRTPKYGGNEYHLFSVVVVPSEDGPGLTKDAVEGAFGGATELPSDEDVEAFRKGVDALSKLNKDNWADKAEAYLRDQFGPTAADEPSKAQLEAVTAWLRSEHSRIQDEVPF